MNKDFRKILERMAVIDIRTTPNYMTATAIATHPNVAFPKPTEVAFSINIDVNENFAKDSEFADAITLFVTTLNNVYRQLVDDMGRDLATKIFLQMTQTMSLKYSY